MSFHGLGVTEHTQGTHTVMLISDLAMITGNIGRPGVGVNPLRGQNNVQGAADMGCQPHQGAGYLAVHDDANHAIYEDYYGVKLSEEPLDRFALVVNRKRLRITLEDDLHDPADTGALPDIRAHQSHFFVKPDRFGQSSGSE